MDGVVVTQLTLNAGVTYMPWLDAGWYGTARIGWGGLEIARAGSGGSDQVYFPATTLIRGPLGSLTFGHEWWIGSRFWLGLGAPFSVGSFSDDGHARTTVIAPAVIGTVTWF
jgi:hypothetical protein